MVHEGFKKLEARENKAIKMIAEGVEELKKVEKKEKKLAEKYGKLHKNK